MTQAPRPTRLLIVEDNDDTAQVLQWGLEQLGYEVAIAHNGPLALQVAQKFSPDVAVLDIGLPVMDGWEVARRLRADPATSRTAIVALTGHLTGEARQRAFDAGVNAYLTKPCRQEEELAEIRHRLAVAQEIYPP